MIPLVGLIRGLCILSISAFPYRAKRILYNRKFRTYLRYAIAIVELLLYGFTYDALFSLFALVYSSLYLLATSGSPVGSIFIIIAIALLPISAAYNEGLAIISIAFMLLGSILARFGDYRLKRVEYIVGDETKVREIDENDENILGVIPNKIKRTSYKLTEFFVRMFNVAYEPPNGLLVSLATIAYAVLAYTVR